jgi:hypothetical protein
VQRSAEEDLIDRLKVTQAEARRQHPEGNGMVLHSCSYLTNPGFEEQALSTIEPGT